MRNDSRGTLVRPCTMSGLSRVRGLEQTERPVTPPLCTSIWLDDSSLLGESARQIEDVTISKIQLFTYPYVGSLTPLSLV